TSRAESQVMRLACIYALLDEAKAIKAVHVRAALSVWSYCSDSCRYIFGDSTGNTDADLILRTMRRAYNGVTRTEISALFGRNKSAREIDIALSLLDRLGHATPIVEDTAGRGRKGTRWIAT